MNNILDYDKIIVTFSGGKDSTACFLYLLLMGVPLDRIELWHHDVDGRSREVFMDWECTPGYCQAFADAFGVPIFFSWREGGFEREMLRKDQPTAPTVFETTYEEWVSSPLKQSPTLLSCDPKHRTRYFLKSGGKGPNGTRRKFPQVSANLSVRWCSSAQKIDVCRMALRNQKRFNGIKTLVISGERGEESAARANYEVFERDMTDNRGGKYVDRHVDRWRPIKDWTEQQVWEIIERYKVRVHPAYYLGFGRVSCRYCIFGNANQMASAFAINPTPGLKMMDYEDEFGVTIKRNISLRDLVAKGTPYDMDSQLVEVSKTPQYNLPIFMDEWVLPSGAYGDKCGPT